MPELSKTLAPPLFLLCISPWGVTIYLLAFCKIEVTIILNFRLISSEIPPFQGLVEHGFRVLELQQHAALAFLSQRRLIAEANVYFDSGELRTHPSKRINRFVPLNSFFPVEPIAFSLSFRSRIFFARSRKG